MPKFVYQDWGIMLDLHLVLATLHMRFTVGIDQDKEKKWWH